MTNEVIWHDLECGGYTQDLPLWLSLASLHGDPVLDVGAGTGRVSTALARAGHRVTALDNDADLLAELGRRAAGHPVQCVHADARDFSLPGATFPLIIVPMQTLQLLGGTDGQVAFMRCAGAHLAHGGVIAVSIALARDFEEFEWQEGDSAPLPDIAEIDGSVFSSQPTAVRREGPRFVLERRRDTVDPAGGHLIEPNRIELDLLTAEDVARAGGQAGLRRLGLVAIPPTFEHIGSEVVILGA